MAGWGLGATPGGRRGLSLCPSCSWPLGWEDGTYITPSTPLNDSSRREHLSPLQQAESRVQAHYALGTEGRSLSPLSFVGCVLGDLTELSIFREVGGSLQGLLSLFHQLVGACRCLSSGCCHKVTNLVSKTTDTPPLAGLEASSRNQGAGRASVPPTCLLQLPVVAGSPRCHAACRCIVPISTLSPHGLLPLCVLCPHFPLRRTAVVGFRALPDPVGALHLLISAKTLFPNRVTFTGHMSLWGHKPTHHPPAHLGPSGHRLWGRACP